MMIMVLIFPCKKYFKDSNDNNDFDFRLNK